MPTNHMALPPGPLPLYENVTESRSYCVPTGGTQHVLGGSQGPRRGVRALDEELHRAPAGPTHTVGDEPASRVLARRVPWLRLEQVLPAAAYAAQAVLAAGSGAAAHGAVLRHLAPALGVAWGVLWWSGRELSAVDIWPSRRPAEHAVRPPLPGQPPDLVHAVTWSTTEPDGRLWQSGLHARLVIPLRSAGAVVGALELLGPVACPRPGRVRTGSVPPGHLDVLGDLLGAALVSAHELDETRQQATLLAAELEVVPAATVVVSPERKLLSVNERFLAMFGVPRSQAQPGGETSQTLAQIYALAVTELPGLLQLLDLAHTPGIGEIHRTVTQRSGRVLDVRG